ncbi:MAG: transporter, partial [Sphingomicrobium sp.]
KVEGGLAFPISIATGSPVTVVLGPELDLLTDSHSDGRHLQLVNLVNASAPVAPRLTLAGELWMATNFDPADTVTLASADVALAYAVNPSAQFDLGVNLGLNSVTSSLEVYGGMSFRF